MGRIFRQIFSSTAEISTAAPRQRISKTCLIYSGKMMLLMILPMPAAHGFAQVRCCGEAQAAGAAMRYGISLDFRWLLGLPIDMKPLPFSLSMRSMMRCAMYALSELCFCAAPMASTRYVRDMGARRDARTGMSGLHMHAPPLQKRRDDISIGADARRMAVYCTTSTYWPFRQNRPTEHYIRLPYYFDSLRFCIISSDSRFLG